MDEFRLLGPLEAVVDGTPVQLAAAKPRALLALLLLNRNRVVSTEGLIDELWGDDPPAQATKTLQVYVSQLRKALGTERLLTRPPGYLLRVDEGELDLDRFEQLIQQARGQGPAEARDTLAQALALWRGAPEPVAARLEELRANASEDWLQASVESGDPVIPQLEELVAREPLRERPRALLMLALYRSGRQADALELFRKTRELFVGELGIEPGPELRELQQAMLRQDTDLRLKPVQRETPPLSQQRRRTWLLVAAALIVLIAAGVTAALVARDRSSSRRGSPPTTTRASTELRSFVFTLENFLQQSHEGRAEVAHVLAGAFDCSLSPQVAAAQLDSVQENRQSLLEQLAALRVPDDEAALRVADRLQRAIHASISADWIYRDWLRAHTSCVRGSKPPAKARRADARATAVKGRFLAAFNPLATRFARRTWRAAEL
ncbi:MAG: AfsR/SARP family transcriptional regulator [Actinobacteria bacterium]|nr:MAG: AfsR/SARP family transcriptional regulator [Actinomycetota bacterium]